MESGKAYSRNTLKSQTYYENDGNWIHLAEDRDFWKKEVVEKVKFHYDYRYPEPIVKRHPPYFGNCLRKSPNSPVELASASAMSLHRQNISSLPPNTEIMRISVSYDDPEHVSVYRNLQIISKLDNLSVFVVVRVCMRIK